MKIIHSLGNFKIEKNIKNDISFLLNNPLGDYLFWQPNNDSISRYQGWYAYLDKELFKILDKLEIEEGEEIGQLTNYFWAIQKNKAETVFLSEKSHSLLWETDCEKNINLVFDIKKSYENNENKIHYNIFEENNTVFIQFISDNEYELWIAIKGNYKQTVFLHEWFLKTYPLDQKRNSPPFQRNVLKAISFKNAKSIIISAAKTKKEAENIVSATLKEKEFLKKISQKNALKKFNLPNIPNKEIKMAYLCARHSLNGLFIKEKSDMGVRAGLPWFFQFWSRDEIISLKSLFYRNPKEIKSLLFCLLALIAPDGKISGQRNKNWKESADAVGWLFLRIDELLKESEKIFSKISFNKQEVKIIKEKIVYVVDLLIKNRTEENFDIVGPNETWMDSLERTGARVEMQAFRLRLYKMAFQITKNKHYQGLEVSLKKLVKKNFWNEKILADGLRDWTVRPNIFIAAYAYPDLLSPREWTECFKNTLSKLWLNWGGLSTIDKKSSVFCGKHTGEHNQSYHNGDSWFWVNNLAALVIYNHNAKKFGKFSEKIINASTEEILWKGAIGHHGEISSSEYFSSEGCLSQAWSAALYIEAINKIFRLK